MPNHHHLLVETPDANLSKGMRQLNGVYTQRFNHSNHRTAYVFQGRYKAILVQKDAYSLELARYVVLNPMRAQMVRTARDCCWSSYRAMLGEAMPPEWLETRAILEAFDETESTAVARYTQFVAEGRGQSSPWEHLKNQVFLGSETFVVESVRRTWCRVRKTERPRSVLLKRRNSPIHRRSRGEDRRCGEGWTASIAPGAARRARHIRRAPGASERRSIGYSRFSAATGAVSGTQPAAAIAPQSPDCWKATQ
jgi:hypothetical protein